MLSIIWWYLVCRSLISSRTSGCIFNHPSFVCRLIIRRVPQWAKTATTIALLSKDDNDDLVVTPGFEPGTTRALTVELSILRFCKPIPVFFLCDLAIDPFSCDLQFVSRWYPVTPKWLWKFVDIKNAARVGFHSS